MVAKLDGTNGLLQQYDYQAPTTGFSYTFAAGVNVLVMNPAGTLATGTITMPASPADGMTISFSSTQTITALTVNANTGQSIVRKPTSFGAGSAMTFVYRLSNTTWYPMTNYATAGTVLQVVQTVKTDTFTTSSTSFVDVTGFSASITPTSATSKILVIASCYASPSLANYAILGKLVRGSTDIAIGDARGSSTRVTFSTSASSTNWSSFFGVTFLDSPATTSSTTYKVQVAAESGSTLLVGGSYTSGASYNGSSPIILTLMEIVA